MRFKINRLAISIDFLIELINAANIEMLAARLIFIWSRAFCNQLSMAQKLLQQWIYHTRCLFVRQNRSIVYS